MIYTYLTLFVFFQLGYFVFLQNKKLQTVDLMWGLAHLVVVLGSLYTIPAKSMGFSSVLIIALVFVWSIRLFIYLFIRNKGKKDDRRYLEIASKWEGSFFVNAYFKIFMVQCVLAGLCSYSAYRGVINPSSENSSVLFLGAILALFGLFYESMADIQLYSFKKNHPGQKLYDKGLYKFSRHPNYFGEICFWWGIYLISVNNPSNWWTIFSPLLINLLILKVSGVPFHRSETNDEAYNVYLKTKNALIPNIFN